MSINWVISLGAFGVLALVILLALGQRKKIGELMDKWEKEMKRLKESEADASATAESERARIKKEIQNESKENIIALFHDKFRTPPKRGSK